MLNVKSIFVYNCSYLRLSLDESVVRSQDTVDVIVAVSRNSVGRYLAWAFINDNWDTLKNRLNQDFLIICSHSRSKLSQLWLLV